jgi:hypothetical protein
VSETLILGLQAVTGTLTARELLPWDREKLAATMLWPLFKSLVTAISVPRPHIFF